MKANQSHSSNNLKGAEGKLRNDTPGFIRLPAPSLSYLRYLEAATCWRGNTQPRRLLSHFLPSEGDDNERLVPSRLVSSRRPKQSDRTAANVTGPETTHPVIRLVGGGGSISI